jgi:hypothetical protein
MGITSGRPVPAKTPVLNVEKAILTNPDLVATIEATIEEANGSRRPIKPNEALASQEVKRYSKPEIRMIVRNKGGKSSGKFSVEAIVEENKIKKFSESQLIELGPLKEKVFIFFAPNIGHDSTYNAKLVADRENSVHEQNDLNNGVAFSFSHRTHHIK